MASPVGTIAVEIVANTGGFERGLTRARGSLGGFNAEVGRVLTRVAQMGAALVVAGGAMAAHLTRQSLDAIDANAKLARILGGSIDGLRGLQLAAQDAGVGQETLGTAMEKLNARLGEAMRGTGEAGKALKRIGLDAAELAGMDVDERLATIADRIVELGLSSQQTADLLRNLGIRQGELVELMQNGGAAIRAARQEIEAFGLAVSEIDATKVEAANDAMERIGLVSEGIGNRIAIALAPVLQAVAEYLTNITKETKSFRDEVDSAIGFAVGAVGFLADTFVKVQFLIKLVEVGWKGLVSVVLQGALDWNSGIEDIARHMRELRNDVAEWVPGMSKVFTEDPEADAFLKRLERQADAARNAFAKAQGELIRMRSEGLPSEEFEAILTRLREGADEAAAAVIAARKRAAGPFEDEDETAAREREQMEKKLEALRLQLAGEEEQELLSHERRLEQLQEYLSARLIAEQEYHDLVLASTERMEANLASISKRRADERRRLEEQTQAAITSARAGAVSEGIELLNIFAGESKAAAIAAIVLNKGLAIAMAIMNTQVAATRALAELGPIAGPPAAAAIEAWGAVKVALIAATGLAQIASAAGSSSSSFDSGSFGGGGGGAQGQTAVGGGTALEAPAPAPRYVTINLEGQLFGQAAVRALIEEINEAVGDGARIRVG